MSQEIVYTSASQGLKPGARGFCTVVSTDGMPKALLERLESLSGYRHAFLPPDPRTAQNPVNYSHLVITVAGRKYHVLSRISDYQLDYTNRTNKLAHHVALEDPDIACCRQGPAELLAQPGFCETAWDGQTNPRHPGRALPSGEARPCRCDYWQQLTGDAGWGGLLADCALAGHRRPASVIFAPGMDTLRLLVEAMSLLPSQLRWEVTCSTYYTKLPAGVDCLWRFVLDGSIEAQAARRSPLLPVIDLCTHLGVPTDTDAVEAARAGRLAAIPSHPTPANVPVPDLQVRQPEATSPPPRMPPPLQRSGSSSSRVRAGQDGGSTDESKAAHFRLVMLLVLSHACVFVLGLIVMFAFEALRRKPISVPRFFQPETTVAARPTGATLRDSDVRGLPGEEDELVSSSAGKPPPANSPRPRRAPSKGGDSQVRVSAERTGPVSNHASGSFKGNSESPKTLEEPPQPATPGASSQSASDGQSSPAVTGEKPSENSGNGKAEETKGSQRREKPQADSGSTLPGKSRASNFQELDALPIPTLEDGKEVLHKDWNPKNESLQFDVRLAGMEGYQVTQPSEGIGIDQPASVSIRSSSESVRIEGEDYRICVNVQISILVGPKLIAVISLELPTDSIPPFVKRPPQPSKGRRIDKNHLATFRKKYAGEETMYQEKVGRRGDALANKRIQTENDKKEVEVNFDKLEQKLKSAAAAVMWCDKMDKLLEKLEKKGRLHIRVYTTSKKNGAKPEVVVSTKGFPAEEEKTGSAP